MSEQHPLMIEQEKTNDNDNSKQESRSITNKELKIIFHCIIIQQIFIYGMFWLCFYVIKLYPANRVIFIVSIPFLFICQFYFAFRKDIKKVESKELFDMINVILFFIFIGFFYFNIYTLATQYTIYISTMVLITHIALYIYVQITDTLLTDQMAWLIILIIPYVVQFFYSFIESISIIYIPLFQWLFSLMLYLIRDIQIKGEFTEIEALILASQINGLVPQILVYPFQLMLGPRDCKDKFLESCDENTKLDYFRKSATTFSVYQLFLALCIQFYNLGLDSIDFYYSKYPILFWISLSVCVVCWPLIMLLHRHLSADALWILASIYSVFYTFIVVGICSYFYQTPYLIQNIILMEEIIAMLFGLSLGLAAYANLPKEKYCQKEALIYMLISPILIFICLIYYYSTHTPIYVLYSFLSLFAVSFYIMFVLIEIHLQNHNNLIKLKDSEYQIGALMLYQPIQKMLIRFVLLIMKLFEED